MTTATKKAIAPVQTAQPDGISGHELADFLAPVSVETFVTEYWGRKPIFIKGAPEKLERLLRGGFDRNHFLRSNQATTSLPPKAGAPQCDSYYIGSANSLLLPEEDEGTRLFSLIENDGIDKALETGASLLGTHVKDEGLARLSAALKAQLRHAGQVIARSVLTPAGGAVGAHFDGTSGLLIHCAGRKRFLIGQRPAIIWPRDDGTFTADGVGSYVMLEQAEWEEVRGVEFDKLTELVMEPGDALYLPAGTVHATEAFEGETVGINIQFQHASFLDIMQALLNETFISRPGWRHLPPVNVTQAERGKLPAEMTEFFAARLDELRELFDGLMPDAPNLNRAWQRMVAEPGAGTLANLALPPVAPEPSPVKRRDRLRLSRRAPITYALDVESDGVEALTVYYANCELSVGGEWVPFLRTLIEQDEFVAGAATQWTEGDWNYPWATVREYLGVLLAQGLIERAA